MKHVDLGSSSGICPLPRALPHKRTRTRTKKWLLRVLNHIYAMFAKIANAKVGIRATNVDVALGRLAAGFYTAVQHSGREWRTENKPVLVLDAIIEWGGPIPM